MTKETKELINYQLKSLNRNYKLAKHKEWVVKESRFTKGYIFALWQTEVIDMYEWERYYNIINRIVGMSRQETYIERKSRV